jgi:hypothetical protein
MDMDGTFYNTIFFNSDNLISMQDNMICEMDEYNSNKNMMSLDFINTETELWPYQINIKPCFDFEKKCVNMNINPKKNDKKGSEFNKVNTNDDLIRIIVDGTNIDENSNDEQEDPELCKNPLCDHKNFTEDELNLQEDAFLVNISNIFDLINLGKTYHCKKNKVYYGINLRILCNLVQPLTELNDLVGMKKVKENIIDQIVFFLQGFNKKERCGSCIDCTYDLPCPQNLSNDMLHTVITGPPGVGKTELGKILGKVYAAMGVLSKGHMHIATRSKLIGKYLGHTAAKTQAFIDKCRGGVMFIDEAYALGNPEGRDSFSKEAIDTLNQNLTERRDFLCIIAGYKDALDECFFKYNEGLYRRFSFKYDITGYTAEELMDIFYLKVKKEDWSLEYDLFGNENSKQIDEKTKKQEEVVTFFKKNKSLFPNYGGDIETFFLSCKIYHSRRVLFKDENMRKLLTLHDLENGLNAFVGNRKVNKSIDTLNLY